MSWGQRLNRWEEIGTCWFVGTCLLAATALVLIGIIGIVVAIYSYFLNHGIAGVTPDSAATAVAYLMGATLFSYGSYRVGEFVLRDRNAISSEAQGRTNDL